LISPVTLAYATQYAVRFDSACFVNGTFKSLGMYNDTVWNFTTESAPPPPVTSLSETFTSCLGNNLGGGFRQYSNNGAATWRCSKAGRTDTNAVSINGASATATFDNTDWLISPALNLAANTDPYLQFWSKTRFTGNTPKQLFVSSNYTSGDPSLATWTALPTSVPSDTSWKGIFNTSLAAYKTSPFVVAFKYSSTAAATANAEEWNIDDVNITTGTVSINNTTLANANVSVVTAITNDVLNVMIASQQADNFTINVYDVTGKTIKTQQVNVTQGNNKFAIALPAIANGVYLINVSNGSGNVSLKAVK
jgi:hypothetical protein